MCLRAVFRMRLVSGLMENARLPCGNMNFLSINRQPEQEWKIRWGWIKHRWPAASRSSFSLNIGIAKSQRWQSAGDVSRRWKQGEEKQKESERKDSLLRHLYQSVVRRVMNPAPVLPSNQWLTRAHTHTAHAQTIQNKHTNKMEISQVPETCPCYSAIIRPSSQLHNVYAEKRGCTQCIIRAGVTDCFHVYSDPSFSYIFPRLLGFCHML